MPNIASDWNETARRDRKARRTYARKRRAELAKKRLCINGKSHGAATHGCRCDWCFAVHRVGLEGVLEMERSGTAPARPAGYIPRPRERGVPRQQVYDGERW